MGSIFARRDFLGGGAATLVAGCAPCAKLEPLSTADRRLAIGDAHVHLFNAADLPVSGFFKNVVIPNDLGQVPQIATAMLDIATRVLKFFSQTAQSELRTMRAAWASEVEDVSAEDFAARIKLLGEEAMIARGFVKEAERDPVNELGDSYHALAGLLDEVRFGERAIPRDGAVQEQRVGAVTTIDRAFLAKIAREGAAAAPAGNLKRHASGFDPAFILSLIHWAFMMTQSRCGHMHRYLREMDSATTRTSELINLLVDYDAWLGDRPKKGSEAEHQVRFWTHYARMAAPRITIHTFAGYDPLAHAEQIIDGRSGYWERLQSWALAAPEADQKVAGFKLYPPMGFNVDTNGPLPDAERAATLVRQRWQDDKRDLARFAAGLNEALDIFFAACARHRIPILAHGSDSQAAYPGAGAGASLEYWAARAARIAPVPSENCLRAIIGHFSADEYSWSVGMPRLLALNAQRRARVCFDIAYCTELLTSEASALALLEHIGRICATQPDGDDWVVFGSDWIMLAQQPQRERYIEMIEKAIAQSTYWRAPGRREKLLGGNLRRFLAQME